MNGWELQKSTDGQPELEESERIAMITHCLLQPLRGFRAWIDRSLWVTHRVTQGSGGLRSPGLSDAV